MNHRWYHSAGNTESYLEYELDENVKHALTQRSKLGEWQPDLTTISKILRSRYQLKNPSSFDIDTDMSELVIEYRAPASFASVIISLHENQLVIERESGSALGVLNDLHKGRHSGAMWRWLIDISAALMIVFSVSGFILIYHGKKHRKPGTFIVLFGALSPLLLYIFATPQI